MTQVKLFFHPYQNNVIFRECYEQEGINLSLSDIPPSLPTLIFRLIQPVKKFSSLFIRLSSFALNLFSEYLFVLILPMTHCTYFID